MLDATDSGTRERVARAVLLENAVTASAISAELGLTPAAVRRHLDALEEDGLAEPYELLSTGQRGRPARAYRLTEAGRDRFPDGYEQLAHDALHHLEQAGGAEAVEAFAAFLAGKLERQLTALGADVAEGTDAEVAQSFADALTQAGYPSSVRPAGAGMQVCQHHCPVAHIASEYPQLCEAETEVFARLLGRHVQRLATIANGDGVCTTHVPALPGDRSHDQTPVSSPEPGRAGRKGSTG